MLLSSITPPSSGGGNAKYIVIALLFAGGVAGLWLMMKSDTPPAVVETAPPAVERPTALAQDDLVVPDDIPDAAPVTPEPEPEPTKHRGGGAPRDNWDCSGEIAAAQAQSIIAQNRVQARSCYERGLKINNLLEGNVQLTMRVDNAGRVDGVRVGGSLQDNQVFSCIRGLAKTWRFPAPTGGRCAVISAPFAFSPRR